LGAETILGGEKGDDLSKDGVREIADVVRLRFFGFLRSKGWPSPLLPALPGAGSTTGVTAGGSLIFLAQGPADSIFLAGIASSSWI
jgi:hypothetical protein